MRLSTLASMSAAAVALCGIAGPAVLLAQPVIKTASGTAFANNEGEATTRAENILQANANNQCRNRGWSSIGGVEIAESRPAGVRNELWTVTLKMKIQCN